jgi:cytochrome c oxidase subunit 2
MAIQSPDVKVWWREPVARGELVWIWVAFLWGLFMFFMMVYWHLVGRQNLSTEVYRVDPAAFEKRVDDFTKQFKVREEGESGIPVARPPRGGDAYMLGRLWSWWPILELEKGQSYRVHISSLDLLHGFSLQPTNINIQVHPGIEHVITLTPTEAGTFTIVCNEFCGLGHHTMLGRIEVVEPKKTSSNPKDQALQAGRED